LLQQIVLAGVLRVFSAALLNQSVAENLANGMEAAFAGDAYIALGLP
jgi:hypothetical protein